MSQCDSNFILYSLFSFHNILQRLPLLISER
nr:MAG TPA: hypothetical protein [Caudoviricetes sp.]